jgi:hypothetical protein
MTNVVGQILFFAALIVLHNWGCEGVRTVGCKKKTGKENFPNVNLVLSICQLRVNVYLTIPNK